MKKVKALGMVFIMMFAFFNFISFVEADEVEGSVCCESDGDSFCVTTPDPNQCSSDFSEELGRNFGFNQFSCSQTDLCQPVCCVDDTGVCSAGMTRIQCLAQGGVPREDDPTCGALSDCSIGSCVIRNQCFSGITALECRLQAEALGLDYDFSTEWQTVNECYLHMTDTEGCCVSADSCTRTTASACSGDFNPGLLCSNNEFVGQCENRKEDYKSCGPGGEDVFWYDSEDQLENMVGVVYDGTIQTGSPNVIGNCDYINDGTVCGRTGGEYQCVDVNCDVGDIFEIEEYYPLTGESVPVEIKMTAEHLYGVNTRMNGESWCSLSYLSGGSIERFVDWYHERNSPGARHYVYSCVLGEIHVDSCDVLRESVCVQQDGDTSTAQCVENEAWSCVGMSEGTCNNNDLFCVLNTAGKNECWPKPIYAMAAGNSRCGKCGDGWNNICDDNECWSFGDCGFDGGLEWWQGALWGAGIGAFAAWGAPYVGGLIGKLGGVGSFFGTAGKYALSYGLYYPLKWLFTGTWGADEQTGEDTSDPVEEDGGDDIPIVSDGSQEIL